MGECSREKITTFAHTHENVAGTCFKDMLHTSWNTSPGQNHPQIGVAQL